MRRLWFSSDEFSPLPGEEEKTNPGRYGEALACWLKAKLADEGYLVEEEPIPEDWGWVVMLHKKPYSLWVGFGNEEGSTTRWGIFVEAEIGIFRKLFHKFDPVAEIKVVEKQLEKIVSSAGFQDVKWDQV